MTNNQKLGQPPAPLPPHESEPPTETNPVDFAFLVTQTFGDEALEHELLDLFVTHSRTLLADLPRLPGPAQADVAHRLKGSARGIGAWAVAEAADRYECADAQGRPQALAALARSLAAADAAIAERLGR